MDLRDTLSVLLPPPRDDEPAGLRQDILDELGDHLSSSYQRELLRGVDPAAARARVLERFGDPAAVARRLWIDAMKGKIMAQRVLVGTCLVVMLVCITAVGLAWRAAAEVREEYRRASEAFAQAHATNKDMLNKMSEMSEAIRHPRSPGWIPVTFELTEEAPDGRPVAQAWFVLTVPGERPVRTIRRTSDASGVADFGLVQPGTYSFRIERSWDSGFRQTSGQLDIQPGSEVHKSIVCPKTPPERVDVAIKCDWPADLAKERLVLYAPFAFRGRTLESGLQWSLHDVNPEGPNQGSFPATRSILCGPGMTLIEILHSRGLLIWNYFQPELTNPHGFRINQLKKAAKLGPGDWADVLEENVRDVKNPSEGVKWEAGTYGLDELIVVRPTQSQDVQAGRRRFDVFVTCRTLGFRRAMLIQRFPPTEKELETVYSMMAGPGNMQQNFAPWLSESTPTLQLPKEYWAKVHHPFEALPGQVNNWTIPLPDELIKAVREALKVDPNAKAY